MLKCFKHNEIDIYNWVDGFIFSIEYRASNNYTLFTVTHKNIRIHNHILEKIVHRVC